MKINLPPANKDVFGCLFWGFVPSLEGHRVVHPPQRHRHLQLRAQGSPIKSHPLSPWLYQKHEFSLKLRFVHLLFCALCRDEVSNIFIQVRFQSTIFQKKISEDEVSEKNPKMRLRIFPKTRFLGSVFSAARCFGNHNHLKIGTHFRLMRVSPPPEPLSATAPKVRM